jgi:hypothetical protein
MDGRANKSAALPVSWREGFLQPHPERRAAASTPQTESGVVVVVEHGFLRRDPRTPIPEEITRSQG